MSADGQIDRDLRRAWEKTLPGYRCILQHVLDRQGYDESGWFVLVHYESESAVIAKYDEQSYFSSQTGINCEKFVWQGSLWQLTQMAELCLDPSFP